MVGSQRRRRAIIVGAGPGGLTAAIALARAGLSVTICERATKIGETGSGLTLWPNATRALDSLGLAYPLTNIGRPLARIAMKNWRGRTIFDDRLTPFDGGGRYLSLGLLRAELLHFLMRYVDGPLVSRACLTGVVQSSSAVVAQFADGGEMVGDLLVAADGLHSAVRALYVNPDALVDAGSTTWRGIARQDAADAAGTTWMGPGRQFGAFPLTAGRVYWFASMKPDPGLSVGHHALLTAAFHDWPDPIPGLLAATPEDTILRTDHYDRAPIDRWTFGRVALLGDAAHPAVPTLGQGACQAIEDAVVLGTCLASSYDVARALDNYQRRRLQRANSLVTMARRVGQLGLWESRIACGWRDLMMSAMPAPLRQRQFARMFAFSA